MGAAATHAAWREGLHGLILMQEKGICKSNAKEKGHDSKDNLYTICQNTAITSCAESQEWLNSLSLFSAMGHHQTAVSFATVMTAFQEMSSSSWPWRWQAPLSLFSELTQSGLQVEIHLQPALWLLLVQVTHGKSHLAYVVHQTAVMHRSMS